MFDILLSKKGGGSLQAYLSSYPAPGAWFTYASSMMHNLLLSSLLYEERN